MTVKGAEMDLRALILDVDGTLAQTADVKRAAFNQAFAEAGLDWIWGRVVFQQIITRTSPGGEAGYYAHIRHPEVSQEMARNGTLEKIQRRQQTIYHGLLESGAVQLRPGVARLMAEAVAGRVKLALCSTGPRQEFETLIYNRFGREMLEALATTVALEDLKTPSLGRAYGLCLQRLSLAAPEVLVIEDSGVGCIAAARLGLTVIATPSQYTCQDQFRAADLVISDLGHPAAPFSIIKGDASGAGHVTLETLRHWHNRANRHTAAAA